MEDKIDINRFIKKEMIPWKPSQIRRQRITSRKI